MIINAPSQIIRDHGTTTKEAEPKSTKASSKPNIFATHKSYKDSQNGRACSTLRFAYAYKNVNQPKHDGIKPGLHWPLDGG